MIINSIGFAQTKLDSLVFVKVNEYRVSLGLNKVEFDTACYKAADCQATYQMANNVCGHTQKSPGFETLDKRLKYFGRKNYMFAGEVCAAVPVNGRVTDTTVYDRLATAIVEGWKHSPSHNEVLMDPKYKYAGVSCKLQITSSGFKNILHYFSFDSMEFFDKK
jgi:uncharacterized protein YkwD